VQEIRTNVPIAELSAIFHRKAGLRGVLPIYRRLVSVAAHPRAVQVAGPPIYRRYAA
jgi:hypothetical protein